MLIGAECEHHDGYHTSADHLVVELTDDAGVPVASGSGHVTITDLHNEGMPFVRYLNGDLGRTSDHTGACACGRALPLLGAVEGRSLDVLTSPDGRIIPGEFFPHLMKDQPAIEAFQVRQTSEDRLKVLLVGEGGHSEAIQQRLRTRIEKQTGPQLRVDFEWVDEIPLTPSGKRRVTVREIERPPVR
jgi:phenylacetate-CoA ligase